MRGEVHFDMGFRAMYAADSSNYRQLPIGVILPRDAADVEAAMAACRATGAAVLPRGAGTSLAGQCANVAVVFDFSKYMNRLGAIDPDAKLATVEPGIVLDRLREAAEVHHLTYAPDPATHSRCTLGGMIGNNSCGVHGLLGGKVATPRKCPGRDAPSRRLLRPSTSTNVAASAGYSSSTDGAKTTLAPSALASAQSASKVRG